ncbi:MAG: prenyltransferase/squalene oxidase repeat-containing protein [Thermoleophilaceae bacterium]
MTWQTTPFLLLGLVLLGGFAWYERKRPPARVVALVAAMAALAVVGRLAFAAVPNVKPTTDIVLFAGYALGGVPGFVVGAVTALVSNVFLGHGPWTAWQMVAWGGVGVGGALLARALRGREPSRIVLAIACAVASLGFGAFMDVYQLSLAARQDLDGYLAIAVTSAPYNLAHVVGSVVFCLLIGPAFIRALSRYRNRFDVTWRPPGRPLTSQAGAATVLAAALVAASLLVAAPAGAATPSSAAVRYLERAQNRDGGFGGARGQSSNQLFTGWSALGVASAGRNPRDVARRNGRSITTYLRRGASLRDTGELERTILVLASAGLSPRRFAGRDLVAELKRRRSPNGSWRGNVAHTAFGVFALKAAGEAPGSLRRSAVWLGGGQNDDGGFGFVPSAESDTDDTGAVLQALAAGDGPQAATVEAVRYLRAVQNPDGGFGQSEGRDSNAQSTAWAVQGLVAAGVRPERVGANPIRYLVRLQRRDGHIAYSRSSDQTPVWVTGQALLALERAPFPLGPTPRAIGRPNPAAAKPSGARAPTDAKRRKKRARRKVAPRSSDPERREARPTTSGVAELRPDPASGEPVKRAQATEEGPSAGVLVGALIALAVLLVLVRRRLGGWRRPAR